MIPLLTAAFIGVGGFLIYTICDFLVLMTRTKDLNSKLTLEMRELEEELRSLKEQCDEIAASVHRKGIDI